MNTNLLNVIKEIIEKNGNAILSDPKRVSAFFADLARDEPKPQKNALVKCLEHGFAQTLKDVSAQDRELCKQRLAQRLHDEEGLDLSLCGETLELLSAVLFGDEVKPKINLCKNCGKELQEGWKTCPFCSIPAESKSIDSEVSTNKCTNCKYANNITLKCGYYGLPLSETMKKDCSFVSTDSADELNAATSSSSVTSNTSASPAGTTKPYSEELTTGQNVLLFLSVFLHLAGMIFIFITFDTISTSLFFIILTAGVIVFDNCILAKHFIKKNNSGNNKP